MLHSDVERVLGFVMLQRQLMEAMAMQHPSSVDHVWLLDFPKHGFLEVTGETWRFVKHGAGLRFERVTPKPSVLVDICRNIGTPKSFDKWALQDFFGSLGMRRSDRDISTLLKRMCSMGLMKDEGENRYLSLK